MSQRDDGDPLGIVYPKRGRRRLVDQETLDVVPLPKRSLRRSKTFRKHCKACQRLLPFTAFAPRHLTADKMAEQCVDCESGDTPLLSTEGFCQSR